MVLKKFGGGGRDCRGVGCVEGRLRADLPNARHTQKIDKINQKHSISVNKNDLPFLFCLFTADLK